MTYKDLILIMVSLSIFLVFMMFISSTREKTIQKGFIINEYEQIINKTISKIYQKKIKE